MIILHISPTYYDSGSIIGGGEKYINYMARAISHAAIARGSKVTNCVLSFGKQPGIYSVDEYLKCEVINGEPWNPYSINLHDLEIRINAADIVIIHQCLSKIGLFIGSHAKLAGKILIGLDHGGGEYYALDYSPEWGRVYDLFLAQSLFAANAFKDLEGKIKVILGPIETDYYKPDNRVVKDPKLVVSIGRIMPHKGFDRIIKALPKSLNLIIAGKNYDTDYFNYLKELSHKSPSKIEIIEGLMDEQVRVLLHRASLFIQASTHFDYRGTYYHKPELLGLAPLEALSCGTPTLVSSAGALNELTSISSCLSFSDDEELSQLLVMHANKLIEWPDNHSIHRQVINKYGIIAFGEKLMNELLLLGCHL